MPSYEVNKLIDAMQKEADKLCKRKEVLETAYLNAKKRFHQEMMEFLVKVSPKIKHYDTFTVMVFDDQHRSVCLDKLKPPKFSKFFSDTHRNELNYGIDGRIGRIAARLVALKMASNKKITMKEDNLNKYIRGDAV